MKKKKPQPFNAAFQGLQVKIHSRTPPEMPAVSSPFEKRGNDLSSFAEAMSGVTPLLKEEGEISETAAITHDPPIHPLMMKRKGWTT